MYSIESIIYKLKTKIFLFINKIKKAPFNFLQTHLMTLCF